MDNELNKQVVSGHAPEQVNQQLLAALKNVLAAWKNFQPPDESEMETAIATAEAVQPVALRQTVSPTDERAAFEAWLQEGIDDTDTVRPSDDKVEAYFATWLASAQQSASKIADLESALFAENQKRLDVERQRDELISAFEEVLRISDRDHDAWNKTKALIAAVKGADA